MELAVVLLEGAENFGGGGEVGLDFDVQAFRILQLNGVRVHESVFRTGLLGVEKDKVYKSEVGVGEVAKTSGFASCGVNPLNRVLQLAYNRLRFVFWEELAENVVSVLHRPLDLLVR